MYKYKELMSQIKYGNKKRIKEILSYTNIDEALIYATKNSDLKRIKYLVDHGANIHYDKNLLMNIISNNQLDAFKYLIDLGLSFHADNDIFLHYSIRNNKCDFIDYLLCKNCIVKIEHLRSAIINSDINVFKKLNDKLISNIIIDDELLLLAVEHYNLPILKYLIEELNYKENFIEALDTSLIYSYKFEMSKYMLKCYSQYNTRFIETASLHNNRKAIKFFIENGINVNINNNMLIINAIRFTSIDLIEFLIENGADTNINIYSVIYDGFVNFKIDEDVMKCFIKHFIITENLLSLDFSDNVKNLIKNHFRYKKMKQII